MEFLKLEIVVRGDSLDTIKSLLPKAVNDFLIRGKDRSGCYACDTGNFYFILNDLKERKDIFGDFE